MIFQKHFQEMSFPTASKANAPCQFIFRPAYANSRRCWARIRTSESLVRRITRWANNVARGIDDRRKSLTKAEFKDGGTVGPVPTGR